MLSFQPILGGLVAAVSLSLPLWSQSNIWTVTGDTTYDAFGAAVDSIGDLNGDGIAEIVVGAPLDDNSGQDSGLLRVVDGASGIVLFTYDGDSTRDEFGYAVAGVGDVNGDGINDFAGSAPFDDNNGTGSGMVRVYSGATGAALYQVDGAAQNDAFGWSLSAMGDVDGDGRSDFLVGANQKPGGASTSPGFVQLVSGATGASLGQVSGLLANDQFGHNVSGGFDLDGDGTPDFVVGIYGEDTNGLNAGAVHVYSGATLGLIWFALGDTSRDHLGASVAIISDVNGDGVPDVAAGAPEDDNLATDAGSVRVYDGTNGAILGTSDGAQDKEHFGDCVAAYVDITGDGIPDFLAGSSRFDGITGADSGKVSVIDGATFQVVQFAVGDRSGDRLGVAVVALSDITGDGLADYLGGARQYGGAGAAGPGFIRSYDSAGAPPPPPPTWPNLPSAFLAVGSGMTENFDTMAGVVPSHMSVNMLEEVMRTADPDAWANVGQLAPCILPYSGGFNLELGGNPAMSSNHNVSNSLIIGLDGAGSTSLVLDYHAINYGEENHTDDGIFLSSDGLNWESVTQGWSHVGSTASWEAFTDVDLTTTPVDTTGKFYLLFGQADNFEFGTVDGLALDDIAVHDAGPTGPTLAVTPMPPVAGQNAWMAVTMNNPGDIVAIGYSLTGGGPSNSPFGSAALSPPIRNFAPMACNPNGAAVLGPMTVPMVVQGRQIWMQAANVTQRILTNGLTFTVQ